MPFIDTLRGFDADFRESSEFRIVIVGLFPASDGEEVASHHSPPPTTARSPLDELVTLARTFPQCSQRYSVSLSS
jgi:hypothetical protein